MTLAPSVLALAADYFDPADDDQSDRELALKCSRDLRVFIREAWPLLEPARPFVSSWHIDCVAEHLMAVSAGEIGRLLINQPPGTTKSSTVAVLWPAWEWLLRPQVRWIFASYAETFAFRDSRKMRALVLSRGGKTDGGLFERRGYQGLLALIGQGWQLTADQNAKGRYDTTATGMRLATSFAGQVTGDHGDRVVCLTGDARITTDRGDLRIRDIVEQRLPVRILGSSGRWQEIAEYESSPGRPLLEIETSDGAVLRCTEDHPIHLEGHGWRPATTVMSLHGDIHMRRLRSPVRSAAGARGARQGWPVLLASLLGRPPDRAAASPLVGASGDRVRALPPDVHLQAGGSAAPPLLLDGLRVGGGAGAASPGVRAVRSAIHGRATPALLWPRLRWSSAQVGSAGRGQRPLDRRDVGVQLLAGLHEEAEGERALAGWEPVRHLPGHRRSSARCSPHRRLEGQPRPGESGDALRPLPQQGAHKGGDQCRVDEAVRIVAVCRVGTPDAVYNLRVEPDHDYYANGLLVHNCDDPLNPKQARSTADRETVNRLWDETMTSRVIDEAAAMVIVQQRLHDMDLTGHLLDKDAGWHHLCLPAEYVPGHQFTYPAKVKLPSGKVIGGDPRTEPGELLDPVRLSATRLEKFRKDLGSYAFAGQYQQQPAPEGGGLFKRSWFEGEKARRWQTGFDRYLELGWDRLAWSWDMAFKDTKGSDFVVGQLWGFHGADCYLMAQIRGRFDFVATCHVVRAGADFEPRATAKIIEDKANGTAVIAQLRRKVPGLIAWEPNGSKYARAASVAPRSEARNVILPAADTIPCPAFYKDADGRRHELVPTTVADWIHEHATFPAGANDDQVDAHSQMLTWANPQPRPDVEVLPPGPRAGGSIMAGVLSERF